MFRQNVKTLRQNMTDAERKLWYHLRDRRLGGYKFRRQFPVWPYIIDFACNDSLLAIEIDGGQHCESVDDRKRTDLLEDEGWHVLRFWNNEVLSQTETVLVTILDTLERLKSSRLLPSP